MRKKQNIKGFTLLEMLVVLGIFAVMTSITLFNYYKFTSDTVLVNMAYEIALTVREAQIYGVSVRSPDSQPVSSDFQYPYGVHFKNNSDTYYLFADINTNYKANCMAGECITPYILQRRVEITDIKIDCSSVNSLDVLYKRPNPEAIFDGSSGVGFAQIKLQFDSSDDSAQYVLIRNNGQIEVKGESEC